VNMNDDDTFGAYDITKLTCISFVFSFWLKTTQLFKSWGGEKKKTKY